VRASIVVLTAVLAAAIPHFSLITNFVGGVANVLVGLVLPPAMFVALARRARARSGGSGGGGGGVSRREIWANAALVCVGLATMVIVTWETVSALVGSASVTELGDGDLCSLTPHHQK